MKRQVTLNVNGRPYEVEVEDRKTLADAIRENCGLIGTHLGCEHGVCGACTVLLEGQPVRSCLMFAVQCDGNKIRTVEGLAEGDRLNSLQESFSRHHALQCGFCTPGFLMLATALIENGADLDDQELREALSSNLCRCTGYQSIIQAVRDAMDQVRASAEAPAG